MRHQPQRPPADTVAVLDSAALLSVSEFHLFRLSYAHWFGHDPDDATIESHFIPYMFRDEVPVWVRHFARAVLRLDREGRLDPCQFGVPRRQATTHDVTRGRVYALGLTLVLLMLLLLAEMSVYGLALPECFFPPCY